MTCGLGRGVSAGASERLIPILMTAIVTAIGLPIPLAIGSGEAGPAKSRGQWRL